MAIMDNPEVPPAAHVQIERDADKDYAIRPIGAIEVTVTPGLVDNFLNRPTGLVSGSKPVRDEEDDHPARQIGKPVVTATDGSVDDFLNRPAELVLSRQ